MTRDSSSQSVYSVRVCRPSVTVQDRAFIAVEISDFSGRGSLSVSRNSA